MTDIDFLDDLQLDDYSYLDGAVAAFRPLTDRALEVFNAVKDHGWISGSFATWVAFEQASAPSDMDIFCKTEVSHDVICDALEELGFAFEDETNFSITYSDSDGKLGLNIQVIYARPFVQTGLDEKLFDHLIRFGDTPAKLVENFDISVTQAVITAPDTVWVTANCRVDIEGGEASIVNTKTPLRSASRLGKYQHAKGYFVSNDEYAKLFNAWEKLTPEQRQAQYYV